MQYPAPFLNNLDKGQKKHPYRMKYEIENRKVKEKFKPRTQI